MKIVLVNDWIFLWDAGGFWFTNKTELHWFPPPADLPDYVTNTSNLFMEVLQISWFHLKGRLAEYNYEMLVKSYSASTWQEIFLCNNL